MDTLDIIAAIVVAFNYLILIPLMIYGLYMFYKYQTKGVQMIFERNSTIVYAIHILSIFGVMTERTMLVGVTVWHNIPLPTRFIYLFWSIWGWGVIWLFVVKCYMLHYRQRYNRAITDRSWRSDIDPLDYNWYITHKNTFGRTRLVIRLACIPYFISVALNGIVWPFVVGEGFGLDFLMLILASIPTMISFAIFFKSRSLSDIHGIRDELFLQCVIMATMCLLYFVVFILTHFAEDLKRKYPIDLLRFQRLSDIFVIDGAVIAFTIVSTYYPLYLMKCNASVDSIMLSQRTRNEVKSKSNLQSMNRVMNNYNTLRIFMNYLVSELSTENILFLMEVIQIKYEYQKRKNFVVRLLENVIDFNIKPLDIEYYKTEKYFTYLFQDNECIMTRLSLPIEMPKSVIITQNEDDLGQQMTALYNKYIVTESLNIPYYVSEHLADVFETKYVGTESQIFNVFDECAIEIMMLLNCSFARFITKSKLCQAISEHINMDETEEHINMDDVAFKELLNSDDLRIIVNEERIIAKEMNK
eukprot:989294_1